MAFDSDSLARPSQTEHKTWISQGPLESFEGHVRFHCVSFLVFSIQGESLNSLWVGIGNFLKPVRIMFTFILKQQGTLYRHMGRGFGMPTPFFEKSAWNGFNAN